MLILGRKGFTCNRLASHPMGVGGRVREKFQRHFSTEQPEKCLSSILADKN